MSDNSKAFLEKHAPTYHWVQTPIYMFKGKLTHLQDILSYTSNVNTVVCFFLQRFRHSCSSISKSWPYLNSTTQATFAQLIPDESQLTVEVLNLFLNFTELKICYFQDLPQDSLELQVRIQVKVLPSCPRLSWRKHLKVLTKWAQYKSKGRQQRFLSARPWADTSTVRRWTGNKWNCPSTAPWNTPRAWRWRKIILFLLPMEGKKKALENAQAPVQTGKMNFSAGKVREESSTKTARQNAQSCFFFFFFFPTHTPLTFHQFQTLSLFLRNPPNILHAV